MTEIGDVDVLLRALDFLGGELAPSSRRRALSTLRGFCGWLVRRQHLPSEPCDAPELTVKRSSSGEVLSFRPDDVERLLDCSIHSPSSERPIGGPARGGGVGDRVADALRVSRVSALTGRTPPAWNATASRRC